MSYIDKLREMNKNKRRTDVENLMLSEMVREDQDDVVLEADNAALDAIVPDNVMGLDMDSSTVDLDEDDGILAGFSLTEIN